MAIIIICLCFSLFLSKGRILHLIKENLLTTTSVRIFVLDEADKLLSHEFQDSIKYEI